MRSIVRIYPGPPLFFSISFRYTDGNGAVAQLGERLLCKQDVIGSIPVSSTILSKDIEANLLELEYLSHLLVIQILRLELVSSAPEGRNVATRLHVDDF